MKTWHKIAAAPVVAMAFLMILGGMSPGKRPEATANFGAHFVDLMQRGGGQLVAAYWQEYKVTSPADEKLGQRTMSCERLDDRVTCGESHKD